MPSKRIAVITARADDRVQKDIVCGIAEAAFAADADVVVFSNIYNHWAEDETLTYENVIYDFFEPQGFDAVIITAEAFMDLSVLSEAIGKIRDSGVSAVVIGGELDGFTTLNFDDGGDIERICEHLITVHGITDIAVLTGQEDSLFARRRVEGCRRAMQKHGLTLDESKVYYGDFWYGSGYELAMRYINGELPLPQAVVCGNDCMAYQLCDTLASNGVRIPEDIMVTGYDCTGGRIYHNPLVTTYRSGRREVGIAAVNLLLSGDYPLGDGDRFMAGNTCPCGTNPSQLNGEITLEHLEHPSTFVNNLAEYSTAQFTQELTLTRTLWEYLQVINGYSVLHEADTLCFCIDKGWNGAEFVGEDYLCCVMEGAESPQEPITVSGGSMLSAVTGTRDEPSVYYFCPLCFQKRLYGFAAFAYRYPERFRYRIRSWNQLVTNALEFLRLKNDIHYLTLCQRTSSLYDALTGFCKLAEFRRVAADAAAGLLAVKIGFPSDKEYIFDSSRRNDIISAAALAIKQVCTSREKCCRTEDDVFLILCSEHRDSLSEKLRVMLHHDVYARFSDSPPVITFGESEGGSSKEISTVLRSVEKSATDAGGRAEVTQYDSLLALRGEVAARPQNAPDIDAASRRLCISKGYFRSIYKKCFGVSYVQDCINERIMLAKYLLCTTVMSVYSVSVQCGYADEKYFARQFHQTAGCSPNQYRKLYCGTASSV